MNKNDLIKELARLVKFVHDKGDAPMWLSDGWREDAAKALAAVKGQIKADWLNKN